MKFDEAASMPNESNSQPNATSRLTGMRPEDFHTPTEVAPFVLPTTVGEEARTARDIGTRLTPEALKKIHEQYPGRDNDYTSQA